MHYMPLTVNVYDSQAIQVKNNTLCHSIHTTKRKEKFDNDITFTASTFVSKMKTKSFYHQNKIEVYIHLPITWSVFATTAAPWW